MKRVAGWDTWTRRREYNLVLNIEDQLMKIVMNTLEEET